MDYRILDFPPQLDPRTVETFEQVETATVGHWHLFGFMEPAIQALLRGKHVVGTAVTLAIPASDSTLLHHAVGMLRPGDVLVIDRLGDDRHACWGGALTISAKARGAAGAIVGGPCTDIAEIEASNFPVWGKGLSPITTRLHNLGGGLNIPIACGGVPVLPGDLVLADDSGVLVLRPEEALAIGQKALAIQARSREREARIAQGERLGQLSGASDKVLAALS
jgi:4-hydroxy-4-methyl-2-oxoglutarate aldolase